MPAKVKKVLKLVRSFVPKDFGINAAYYRTDSNSIEFTFFVDEKNANRLIGYLNSLSGIIEKEIGGIKIESRIYIKKSKRNINELVEEKELVPVGLRTLSYAV